MLGAQSKQRVKLRFASRENMFLYLELAALDSNIFILLNVIFGLFLPVASCSIRDKQLACLHDLLKQESACRLGFQYCICCELLSVIYKRAYL